MKRLDSPDKSVLVIIRPNTTYLVIDVRDVHHKMDVIAEVVRHDPSKDVLSNIVSG